MGESTLIAADVVMYLCPRCGSTEIEVVVEVWATLIQTGDNLKTDTSTPDNAGHEWDENSLMRCRDCDYREIAGRFSVTSREAV